MGSSPDMDGRGPMVCARHRTRFSASTQRLLARLDDITEQGSRFGGNNVGATYALPSTNNL